MYQDNENVTGNEEMTAIDGISEPAAAPAEEAPEQYEIIGVTFKSAGKIYYFDANGITARAKQCVIVDTSRGLEYGTVALPNKIVPVSELVLPLRKVVRIADRDDDDRYRANCEKEEEAFAIGLKKIAEHELNMKLIDVEYTFDNAKLLFYFTSEERVDFRELVKDLASIFRTRIELRQIGLRDEAKIMGGFGICGREFCCHSFLGDFVQVSIKMAKEQNLALNASKISGACGRLMCCLRYEHEAYQEELRNLPKVDSRVITPDGEGVVTEVQPLTGLVKVRLDKEPDKGTVVYDRSLLRTADGKPVYVPRGDESNNEAGGRKKPAAPERPQKTEFRAVTYDIAPDPTDMPAEKEDAPKEPSREQPHKKHKRRPSHKPQAKPAQSDGQKTDEQKQHQKGGNEHKKGDGRKQKPPRQANADNAANEARVKEPREGENKNASAQNPKNDNPKKKNNRYRRHGSRRQNKNPGNSSDNNS